jgi:hypothetical protein
MVRVTALVEALSRGAKVDWKPPDQPRLRVPKGMGVAIQAEIEDVREVLTRAVKFKKQLSGHGPFNLMILPKAKNLTKGCISCGIETFENKIRCPICQTASWIALDMKPPVIAPLDADMFD